MKLISIGKNIRDGSYTVHSRFDNAVNFTCGDDLVFLVNESIGAGPSSLVVNESDFSNLESLSIKNGIVSIGRYRYNLSDAPIYDPELEIGFDEYDKFFENLCYFERLLLDYSHPKGLAFLLDEKRESNFTSSFEKEFVKRMREGVKEIFSGNIIKGVKRIRGLGFGLTPSGDDFISGYLIALNLVKKIYDKEIDSTIEGVYDSARGESVFVNKFLSLARDGYCSEKFKLLVYTLLHGNKNEIKKATMKLLEIGDSSGADMAVGFLMGMNGERCL